MPNETSLYKNNPESVDALPHDLKDMKAYVLKVNPDGSWIAEPEKIVHLRFDQRVLISFQKFSDCVNLTLGVCRDEELADLGVYGAELDSQQFAQNLVHAISDHMSIRNLTHLAESIENELKSVIEERRLKIK